MTSRHRTQGAEALEKAGMVLVYGRMDPIATFSNTRRALSVAWNIPSESYTHAQENLSKANKILTFLYPLYDSKARGGATAINQGPLMRVSFGNLIRDAKTGKGLLGYVNGFTFDPDLELGMFAGKPFTHKETKDIKKANNLTGFDVEYYPKAYRLNFEFTVLHEHPLGFRMDSSGKFVFGDNETKLGDMNFPYGVTSTPAISNRREELQERQELARQMEETREFVAAVAGRVKGALDAGLNLMGLGGEE